ncbi:hypothetical protein [Halorarius litoreus]|uniref:hypothetical protein n=1 Tax=Halorarius litoreus TaxID=2962676 RepID=UPI0020CFC28A|nr:hypothetical protein [Halorarius litoreus]
MTREQANEEEEGGVVEPDQWEDVAPNPDLERDMGYEIRDWEAVSARAAGGDRLLFLPTDEDLLREEAFVVADTDVVCDVIDHL